MKSKLHLEKLTDLSVPAYSLSIKRQNSPYNEQWILLTDKELEGFLTMIKEKYLEIEVEEGE
jgi:hypothetical protein